MGQPISHPRPKYDTRKTKKRDSLNYQDIYRNYSELTIIKPQPVGRKARQQTTRSLIDRSHMIDRATTVAVAPRKRRALNSLNVN